MKKLLAFGFFVTSFVSLAIFISAVGAAPATHAATASPAVAKCLDTCAGTCNENASTGVVTCSTDAAVSTGCPSGQVMDGFGTCATQATIDAQNTAATAAQNQPSTQSVTPTGASGFTALAPIPGLTDAQTTSVLDGNALATFFNNLYKYLIGLAATLAVIEIIWAGIEIAFNKEDVSKLMDSKGRIYNAIFGLILVLSPYLVFSIINPSILNLSLNLPPIKLDIPAGGADGSGGGTPVVDPATQCSVTGTAGILQIATCPSSSAATTWGQSCSGNLSDGPQMALANQTVTSVVKICAGKNPYVFINKFGTFSIANSITILQPLARTTDNPNNGASAMQFVNTCNTNLGWKTCISRAPAPGWAIDCQPVPTTQLPQGTGIGKCYNETLTCEDKSFIANDTCSASPNWTPFQ